MDDDENVSLDDLFLRACDQLLEAINCLYRAALLASGKETEEKNEKNLNS
jgi:hypothetical protein